MRRVFGDGDVRVTRSLAILANAQLELGRPE
jgi:hypothetical protein